MMTMARAQRIVLGLELGSTRPALREAAWMRLHRQVWIGYEAAQDQLRRERTSAKRRAHRTRDVIKAIQERELRKNLAE